MKYGREMLRKVAPYVPGEQPQEPGVIKLNTNENPYPPSPKVLEAIRRLDGESMRKYPDPPATRLRQVCAERYGYPDASWVVAGNGMDELLALAVRTFCDPGDEILTTNPTYTLYEVLAELHGARIRTVETGTSFEAPDTFFATPARMAFLPRPNAPSGLSAPKDVVERWAASFEGLIVIDEAYVDFGDDSCIDLPLRHDNVIVMRTFSKSFSLAGMRLGIAFAHPDLILEFMKTKDPANVDVFTQAAGIAAIEDYDYMVKNAAKVKATRKRLTAELERLGFTAPPSQANFVLAQWSGDPDARSLFEGLRAQHIYVRYFNKPRLDSALRITVGTDEEIDALLTALTALIASGPAVHA